MSALKVDQVLDCKGLACPMPVVRTKKTLEGLNTGEVLEIMATDRGSVADLQGWAKRTGHQYIGLKESGQVFHHYIRKVDPTELKEAVSYPHTITPEEVKARLSQGEALHIVDVREPAEFAFGHIPGALSIPVGDLDNRLDELDASDSFIIVCRSGYRSDLACQLLEEKGYHKVKNMVHGMNAWDGDILIND
ncbi:sulfurtransferase TusA family protein [Paenibacillus aquistagni]|uniref:Rhodanese-related sulfurtransferase n=1 Tax=Paenibacillus aquistagni TaxID=1852522 RepID=A0A1X7IAL7_9BACL|nr:sulfurtransferase TusA family protein [Paenibacillus aquistagni]SMG11194.1 Rhodanese-related sulfurtransferase [Paenibacillus aquistagni]